MPGLSETAQKIHSLTNIRQVTAAMNLIASLRFRRLAARQHALETFEQGLAGWLAAAALVPDREPAARRQGSVLAVVFASDRGLCGSHNHAVGKALDQLAFETAAQGRSIEVMGVGARGAAYARRQGYAVVDRLESRGMAPDSDKLNTLADGVMAGFLAGRWDGVVLVYNRFVSTLKQAAHAQAVLPWRATGTEPAAAGHAAEGGTEALADEAGTIVIRALFAAALSHSLVSEQAARMTAMDSASQNAADLLGRAVKERQRVRQAGITRELLEIVSGKEAMKR